MTVIIEVIIFRCFKCRKEIGAGEFRVLQVPKAEREGLGFKPKHRGWLPFCCSCVESIPSDHRSCEAAGHSFLICKAWKETVVTSWRDVEVKEILFFLTFAAAENFLGVTSKKVKKWLE